MEVFQTENYYIFVRKEKSLWWNRSTSEFQIKCGWDLSSVDDIECIGLTHGIVGTIALQGVLEPHLIIVKEANPVGVLYAPHLVYKIKSICILGAEDPDSFLLPCLKHNSSTSIKTVPSTISAQSSSGTSSQNASPSPRNRLFESSALVNKTWGAVKSAGSTIKNTTEKAAAIASNQVKSTMVGMVVKDPVRIEKRVMDELHRIFDDSDSFYYSLDCDITNNLQRREESPDDRFYWNRTMVQDIAKLGDPTWVLPIVQGFVQIEQCVIGNECFTLALVSRRSRYRAGTRYKRRGIDENGHCANYVETEQVLSLRQHQISFTQVRGSVPVYWSQPGYKYRPPPRLDRDDEETHNAFKKHFNEELSIYQSVAIINLVEQSGKEKIIGDAYASHVLRYNSEKLIYVTFDFHEYCRGMRFENVSSLIEALAPEAGSMGFHWRDTNGAICNQKSVFRVNCMDCLDRTNVVQTALGKAVLESQLVKLGLAPPYSQLPDQLKIPFMVLWANNGDVISRQYAGTNALKGDYTRTGERKLTGLVKDGMNSANRYYLARFKDTYRQATIDMMLGNQISAESVNALGGQSGVVDETDALEGAEHARLLVEDCRRQLLGTTQHPLGAWGLIDADPSTGDLNETEVDTILILTNDSYIVAEYDSHLDKIVRFENVSLDNIALIELGLFQHSKMFQGPAPAHLCIRLNYSVDGIDGYFHMFRSPNIRFFNNVAVVIRKTEEITESLTAIVDLFRIALENRGRLDVPFHCGGSLQRRKSRTLLNVPQGIPRNLSESQLVQMGSKALSNVAGQFSKIGQTLNPVKIGRASSGKKAKAAVPMPYVHTGQIVDEAERGKFTVGSRSSSQKKSDGSSSEEEADTSIYEPDEGELVQENPLYNENVFLPSVGIVMGGSGGAGVDDEHAAGMLEDKDSIPKMSSDVSTMSISSVTDHINMPAGMLECASPIRGRSPTPEIRVDVGSTSADAGKYLASEGRSVKDLSLNLSGNQSDNALKQLKKLTSPLSNIGKGLQSLSANLDPRKISVKTPVLQARSSETPTAEIRRLEEKWDKSKCRSKLIAL
ncbi:phosphatidylinositide phosphatase SAC2 isoform X2 [Uranotaenia lowii]|uniref:phosphatidylinositide phosphatase SAC2 isoform X2 n=1 Tax=Uranotaenia lowii TaxID=190385 RepID=UPI00247A4387|nr:phosphatidylinositide phosphatase SAC2 isoform X2 [Uranotaenia lowii]